MKRIILAVVTITTVIGCTVDVAGVFDRSTVAYIHARGTNTVEGNAFIRQSGGGVVTCAGEEVSLIPAGEYARERMRVVYGTDVRPAYRPAGFFFALKKLSNTGAGRYWEYQRNTKCDSEGRFKFKDVAAGSYFVTTRVLWTANPGETFPTQEGGSLMAPVQFFGTGKVENVVLSP